MFRIRCALSLLQLYPWRNHSSSFWHTWSLPFDAQYWDSISQHWHLDFLSLAGSPTRRVILRLPASILSYAVVAALSASDFDDLPGRRDLRDSDSATLTPSASASPCQGGNRSLSGVDGFQRRLLLLPAVSCLRALPPLLHLNHSKFCLLCFCVVQCVSGCVKFPINQL